MWCFMKRTPLQHAVNGAISQKTVSKKVHSQSSVQGNKIAYSSELNFLWIFITENLAGHVQIHFLPASLSKAYYIILNL
jgi:hypothetical protein